MLFHQNRIFPSTMRKVWNILTEIYLHIVSEGMFSYSISFSTCSERNTEEKRELFPPVFSVDASRRVWLCERSLM